MDLAGHRLCASCNITGTIGKLVARAKCANPFLKGKSLPSSLLVPSGQIQILRLLFLTYLDRLFIDSIAFFLLLLSINK